jgi:hypothetical protein
MLFLSIICDSHQLLSHQHYAFVVLICSTPSHLLYPILQPTKVVGGTLGETLHFIIFTLYLPLEYSGVCVVFRFSAVVDVSRSYHAE